MQHAKDERKQNTLKVRKVDRLLKTFEEIQII
jgi:hypothetical protein